MKVKRRLQKNKHRIKAMHAVYGSQATLEQLKQQHSNSIKKPPRVQESSGAPAAPITLQTKLPELPRRLISHESEAVFQ